MKYSLHQSVSVQTPSTPIRGTPSDMTTPPHPIAIPHARGVFRQQHTLNGNITFHVYRCDGELMEVASVHPDWDPDQMERELVSSLGRMCATDDAIHRATCPALRERLRLV